jgi:hypothetical protein
MRNTDHDLCLKPIPNLNQCAWMTARGKNAFWTVLSDIALRLESLVCNDGVTETTNWTMKRLLSPFRLNMGGDGLLARMNLSKHGRPGSATGVWIALSAMDEIPDIQYDIPEWGIHKQFKELYNRLDDWTLIDELPKSSSNLKFKFWMNPVAAEFHGNFQITGYFTR